MLWCKSLVLQNLHALVLKNTEDKKDNANSDAYSTSLGKTLGKTSVVDKLSKTYESHMSHK